MHDFLLGFREFRARPGVSAIAVVTLALGVAGATTMFAMLGAIGAVMVPRGVDAERVGRIVWTSLDESGLRSPLAPDEYVRLKPDATKTPSDWPFEFVSASTDATMTFGEDGPDVSVKRVSADFFRTFGFRVSAGRSLTVDDERGDSRRVAVVSESFLRRWPSLGVGRVVRLGTDDFTMVGTLPDRHWFAVPGGTDVWLPLPLSGDGTPLAPSLVVTARLRSPEDGARARAQLAVVTQRAIAADAATRAGAAGRPRKLSFITLEQDVSKRMGFGLAGLLAPSIVVLLIACGNVANLLLARAARREREMAVRAALGAGRARLVRERLAESAWLAVVGGGLGLLLASLSVQLLRAWVGRFEPSRTAAQAIQLDSRALVFSLAVTAAIPFVFGLVPALAASRPNLVTALHQSPGRRRPRRGPYGGRDLLVIVEIALAVVLVVCAGMFSRFFVELGNVRWGFDPARIVAVSLELKPDREHPEANARRVEQIVSELQRVPGVHSVASGGLVGLRLPRDADAVEFEGCEAAAGAVGAITLAVDDRYFSTLGLPTQVGRAIGPQDTAGAPAVGVISARHAARCWPGRDPIGRRFRVRGSEAGWASVVGVAPDQMTTRALGDMPQPVYVPVQQAARLPGTRSNPGGFPAGLLFVRTEADTAMIAGPLRAAIRRVDPSQSFEIVGRVDETMRRQVGGTSMATRILGGFGAFALALAALGVFSVISYMVAERTREFGVRIALGASRRDVLRLLAGQAAVIVSVGATVSIAGTLAVTRVAFREMAELAATDYALWSGVTALLAVVALAATFVPARRATRIEPMTALRAE
jgi:putative ABC transport system permease protein